MYMPNVHHLSSGGLRTRAWEDKHCTSVTWASPAQPCELSSTAATTQGPEPPAPSVSCHDGGVSAGAGYVCPVCLHPGLGYG